MDCIEIINRFKQKRVFSTEEYNLFNKAMHEYHIKFGYEKGKRPKISKSKRKRVFEKCNGKCVYCGKQLTLGTFDACVDHVVPIAKGGNNEDNNLVMACKRCNCKKGTKTLEELGIERRDNVEDQKGLSEKIYNR